MTDYFALLEQPRSPWLDLEQLKEVFHRKTLRAHPDAQRGEAGSEFAELNEAYEVLREPKRRLQHLLALFGEAPSRQNASIPPDVEDLFPLVAEITRDADAVSAKRRSAANALSRSVAQAEATKIERRVDEALHRMSRLHDSAVVRLQQTSTDDTSDLQRLYLLFSYLTRWMTELEEKRLALRETFI